MELCRISCSKQKQNAMKRKSNNCFCTCIDGTKLDENNYNNENRNDILINSNEYEMKNILNNYKCKYLQNIESIDFIAIKLISIHRKCNGETGNSVCIYLLSLHL